MKTLLFLLISISLSAQQIAVNKTSVSAFGYLEYSPPGATALLVCLHGFGEAGNGTTDLHKVDNVGIAKLIAQGSWTRPEFVVLSPQTSTKYFSPLSLEKFIRYAIGKYQIDTTKIYITGLSGGAISIYQYLAAGYKTASAVIPISGYGHTKSACINDTPIWAFHGDADGTVALFGSTGFIAAYNKCGFKEPGRVTVYTGVGHDAWTRTYDLSGMKSATKNDPFNENIYDWLLSHTKGVVQKPPGFYVDGVFVGADSAVVCNQVIKYKQ